MFKAFVTSLLLLCSVSAFATPVTFAYTGTLTNSSIAGTGAVGSQVTGTITFDDALFDSDDRDEIDDFVGNRPENAGLVFSSTFNSGSVSETTSGMNNPDQRLVFVSTFFVDQVFFQSTDTATDNFLQISIQDRTNLNLVAGTGNLSGMPLDLTTLLLSSITDQANNFLLRDDNGTALGQAFFTLDSISAVPLPAAAWLFLSALCGLFGIRKLKAS